MHTEKQVLDMVLPLFGQEFLLVLILYAQEPIEWTGQTRVRRDFRDCSDHWAIESWMDLQ